MAAEAALLEARMRTEVERARQEGFEAGREAATREWSSERAGLLSEVSRTVSGLLALRPQLRERAERDVVLLAVAVARRVIHRAVHVDEDAMQGLVKAAFSRMQKSDSLAVRISTDLEDLLRSTVLEHGNVRLAVDATLPPGSLLLESDDCNLDASVDTQLSEIQRGFADRLGWSS